MSQPTAVSPVATPLPEVGDNILHLTPYVPGKPIAEVERELGITGLIKLASNENMLGPSPRAVEAVQSLAAKMHLYPDANCFDLRCALAERLNVPRESLVFGNGSDDVIHLLGITFLKPCDEMIQGDPSFVRYEAAAVLNEAVCRMVPLLPDWNYDLEGMLDAITPRTRLLFIANCNNPTGGIVTAEALETFLDRVPPQVIVVMDEAYYEYGMSAPEYPDTLRYVREGRNVVVLRTFSKAYGLAGFRIGYGVMRPEIAGWLNRTREPFNVNQMAQAAAVAALDDTEHIARTVAMNEAGKQLFYSVFTELGLPYTPTYGNFVWVDVRRDAREVYNALLHRGIITRTSPDFNGPTHLRVTIGTDEQNQRFVNALRHTLE